MSTAGAVMMLPFVFMATLASVLDLYFQLEDEEVRRASAVDLGTSPWSTTFLDHEAVCCAC